MKTGMLIFVSAVVCVSFFVAPVFAQNMTKEQYAQYVKSGKEQADTLPKWRDDPENRVPYKSKTLYAWLEETRQVFKKAEANLSTKEEKDFLSACQKMRQAGHVHAAFYPGHDLRPEISRAAYTGPFCAKQGLRDDQFMIQIFYVRSYNDYVSAGEEYLKVLAKTSERAQAEVAQSLYKVRGKTYETERYQLALRATGKPPISYPCGYGFSAYIFTYSRRPALPAEAQHRAEMQRWQQVFKDLDDPNKKPQISSAQPVGGGRVIMQYGLSLIMNNGPSLGGMKEYPMITRDEFLFISRQSEQCWQTFLNPPEEILNDLPRYTYWQRDADPNEPPLILKVEVPSGGLWTNANCYGGIGPIVMQFYLPNSFLKGLCPEWKKAMADFEKFVLTKGPSAELMKAMAEHRDAKEDIRNKDRLMLNEKEDELHALHFGIERLKWHRISADEYAKLKAGQEEWAKARAVNDTWDYKQRLCANFQRLSPLYNQSHSTIGSDPYRFSLLLLEKPWEIRTAANIPKNAP